MFLMEIKDEWKIDLKQKETALKKAEGLSYLVVTLIQFSTHGEPDGLYNIGFLKIYSRS